MSTLALDNVTHRYPRAQVHALRDVSLTVPDGQMVSVVGPSGSGKSTLLRVAAGLEWPQAGSVLVNGADVTGVPTERRDLTVMFQHPHLFDHLDVGGNVAFAPRLAGLSRRDARRCAQRYLRLVHLEGFDRRAVTSLSGGQQQRVALARALAAERGAMLLDEPFSSLDRELRSSMHDLLGEVRAALSPTVLMITHDLDEASLADSTVVLIDGVVHQHAPAALLHTEPATLATSRLVGGFVEIAGQVRERQHISSWGTHPLPHHCPMTKRSSASADVTLLVRKEDLRASDPLQHALGDVSLHRRGQVIDIRMSGARRIARVRTDEGDPADVELDRDQSFAAGDSVSLTLKRTARTWAVLTQSNDVTNASHTSGAQPTRAAQMPG